MQSLCAGSKDVICLGDANLCANRWNDENFAQKELADLTHNFLLETSCCHLVKGFTRSEVGPQGEISRSCIDHLYTNVPDKISAPELVAVGSSDHLGIVIKKFTKAPKIKPKIIQKRNYKNFIIENFLNDILTSHLNEDVTACDDLEAAAEMFQNSFGEILDKHAPIKKIQVRKNYLPFLSEETKLLMEDRKALKEESVVTGDKVLVEEAKRLGKLVKESIIEDEKMY